jgi:hypothetical protein
LPTSHPRLSQVLPRAAEHMMMLEHRHSIARSL